MSYTPNNPNLDKFLADSQIKRDLNGILSQPSPSYVPVEYQLPPRTVEIDEKYIEIPSDTKLEVIAKSYRQNNYESGFGNHYAVLVAIGGVVEISSGIPRPKYCYATLFYSSEKQVITLDFHSEMR